MSMQLRLDTLVLVGPSQDAGQGTGLLYQSYSHPSRWLSLQGSPWDIKVKPTGLSLTFILHQHSWVYSRCWDGQREKKKKKKAKWTQVVDTGFWNIKASKTVKHGGTWCRERMVFGQFYRPYGQHTYPPPGRNPICCHGLPADSNFSTLDNNRTSESQRCTCKNKDKQWNEIKCLHVTWSPCLSPTSRLQNCPCSIPSHQSLSLPLTSPSLLFTLAYSALRFSGSYPATLLHLSSIHTAAVTTTYFGSRGN